MGQKYSTEVTKFRKQSKQEAQSLGFLPNKRAVKHPLNQPPKQTKDPRSEKQSSQWEEEAKPNFLEEIPTEKHSLVIDIMEARRIGFYEPLSYSSCRNFVVFRFEVVNERGKVENENYTQYRAVFEDRGWKYERWIDKFRMVSFNLWADIYDNGSQFSDFSFGHYYRIAMKSGNVFDSTGRLQENFKELYDLHGESNPIYFTIQSTNHFVKNWRKLDPTWYQWNNTDKFIKISAQIISNRRIPNVDNFLPYTQWPPMILHTGKTRLELMMEEEESGDEESFKGDLGSHLISYNPATLPGILGVFSGDFNRDFMLAFGLVMCAPIIDRTGTLNVNKYEVLENRHGIHILEHKLRIKNLYPVPKFDQTRFTPKFQMEEHSYACSKLADLLLSRASEILEKANHERRGLKVLWSGGIDTSAMVSAFHKVIGSNENLREIILICFCESSLTEYPLFFEKIIKKFKYKQIPHHVRDILVDHEVGGTNDIIVTGDPADMIFGTYVMSQCILDPPNLSSGRIFNPLYMKLESHWTIFADFMVFKGLLSEQAKPYWLEWIKPFVAASPIHVQTVFDFLWWCSYGLKYQHDLNRIFYNNQWCTIPRSMVDRFENFYDTNDFSQWSYHFHYSKMKSKKVWASYKHALKDFIKEVTGDNVYYSAKFKMQSVSNNWGFEHALDSNYNLIRWELCTRALSYKLQAPELKYVIHIL